MRKFIIVFFIAFQSIQVSIHAQEQNAELVVQTGHTGNVNSVVFSPDNKTLASGSSDKTIKLWDVATGQEIRTLTDSEYVSSVAFSPDGKMLVSGGGNDDVRLWDVATGQELRTLKGHLGSISSVAFSTDGKMLASGSDTLKLWNTASRRELFSLNVGTASITSVAFSPDGKMLASGNSDHTVILWDINSGKEIKTFVGHTGDVTSVAFSPDGKSLISVDQRGSYRVKLWDIASGKGIRTFRGEISAAFSPDGKTIASGISKSIKLYDATTGQEINTFTGHIAEVNSVAFSTDGKMLASGTRVWIEKEYSVKLWNVATGQEIRTLAGRTANITSVTLSPDDKTLAAGSEDFTIKLWDLSSGKGFRSLRGHTDVIESIVFSPDGKILASGTAYEDKTIKLWDVARGHELKILKRENRSSIRTIIFSPDGKTLASGDSAQRIVLWDVATGQKLKNLGKTFGDGIGEEPIKQIAFSADGKIIASEIGWDNPVSSNKNKIILWDAISGQKLKTFQVIDPNTRSQIFTVVPNFYQNDKNRATTNDSKFEFEKGENSKLNLLEVKTGKLMASLIALGKEDWTVVTPNGLFDGTTAAWRQLIWRLDNNTYNYVPVEAFFKEFFYPGLLQEIMQGKTPRPPDTKLSEIDIRQPIASIMSINSRKLAEQSFGRSGVLLETLAKREIEVVIEVAENNGAKRIAKHPAASGAEGLRLFRNGSLVKVWKGDAFSLGKQAGCEQVASTKPNEPRRVRCQANVPIIAGANEFTAYAFNHDNVKSTDATLTVTGAESLKRKGTAYILAIGINEYANSQYNLRYAVADAQGFGEELKRRQEQLGIYERVQVTGLINENATKEKIIAALTALQGRTQPEDALIVYFAGHGTAQNKRFYLIPHDLGYTGDSKILTREGLEQILAHSISDRELEAVFETIDAGQLTLIIDACNSGQALEAEEKRRGPMNSAGLAQLAYEKGMYVLTAAQGFQVAKEAQRLGHGYLTYALVEEGLKTPAADANRDKQIILREWLDYATTRVPQMQEERLAEQSSVAPVNSTATHQAADASATRTRLLIVQAKDPSVDGVQRPRVFYRREQEARPLIVARP